MKRLLGALSLLVTLPVLLAGTYVIGVRLSEQRDEKAFITGLDDSYASGGCNAKTKVCRKAVSSFAGIDDGFLIAEGDKACAWLEQQPYPWWRRETRFSFDGLVARYRKENPPTPGDWTQGRLRPELRASVVGAAWHDLCGAEWRLREPKNPFNKPPAD